MQMQQTNGMLARLAGLYLGPQQGAKDATVRGSSALQSAAHNAVQKEQADTLALSEKARAYLQADAAAEAEQTESAAAQEAPVQNDAQAVAEENDDETQPLREQLEAAHAQAKADAAQWEEKLKCLKIMANMVSGKKVPVLDQQYLCKHDTQMYAKAVTLRTVAPRKAEKAKRVTDDADFAQDAAGKDRVAVAGSAGAATDTTAALLQSVTEATPFAMG